jgi:hypothetical protein
LLSSWEIAFEAIDVQARPEAWDALRRLGVPAVPAVVVGDRAVHGWNPSALAELVGMRHVEGPRLPVDELARRLDRVLDAAGRAMEAAGPAHLGLRHPARDRTLRQLGYHTFRLSLALRDAVAERRLPYDWLAEAAPASLVDGPAIARYGAGVREALRAWLAAGPSAVAGTVETYYGPQDGHALLERTVWHAAQHVRQLYDLLGAAGVRPGAPLTEADLASLPLPREIW